MFFLDWKMACDKVQHESLVVALQRFHIPESWVTLLTSLYDGATFEVSDLSHAAKGKFWSGIRQGCPLSPYLVYAGSNLHRARHGR